MKMLNQMYRSYRLGLLTLWTILLLGFNGWSQENLSLTDAITIGLENNYQIQLAKIDRDIADKNDDWALAGRYPTINLTLNSNNGYTNTNNPASIQISSSILSTGITPGVEANWVLFDGYRVKFTKRQQEELLRLSEGQLQVEVENTISSIMQAYYGAQVQKEQLEVLQEVLELSRDRIEYEEARKEFGQAGSFDILQTQDAYLSDSTDYLIQQNNYDNSLRNLKQIMGLAVTDSRQFNLVTDLAPSLNDYEFTDLESRMQLNNKSLQNLRVNRELANIGTQIQESSLSPTVSIRAGGTYNVGLSSGTQTFNFAGMPSEQDIPEVAAKTFNGFLNLAASFTIFDAGARKRRIEASRLSEVQSEVSYQSGVQSLGTQLANTLATYNNQKNLLALTEGRLENARQNLTIAEERFRAGVINSFDYRSIQLSYINANQARLNALLNLQNTETELTRLTGGLIR